MNKKYNYSLCILRRDLRLDDNTALLQAFKNSRKVIACFIVDPAQVSSKNEYKSDTAIQFMSEAVQNIKQDVSSRNGHFYVFYGHTKNIVEQLFERERIDALYINKDYTPFSSTRDSMLETICKKNSVAFYAYDDALLAAPGSVLKKDGKPYTIFTPFYKKARTANVPEPEKNKFANYYTKKLLPEYDPQELIAKKNRLIPVHGSRTEALSILKNIGEFEDYTKTRDFPALQTTRLSAYVKFSIISVREVYHVIVKKLGKQHPLIRQLYWRDFYTQLAYSFPKVFGHAFYEKYDKLTWSANKKHFESWRTGTTGFPIVDAGMRELVATGFMHNRVRMIAASFLIKDLHINWRMGEKYFAQKLVDYDPAVNNGNWQWVASTGADAQPYFRIFNPWLQQKKFDPQCEYIKKWIPELQDLPPKTIHRWYDAWKANKKLDYPQPMVDHAHEAALAKKYYKFFS